MYRNLDAGKIIETCRATSESVTRCFPGSGLSKVAEELLSVGTDAAQLSRWLARPHLALRILAGIGIVGIMVVVFGVVLKVKLQPTFGSIAEFLQGSDAALNEVIFLGAAIFFFVTLETRLKRRRALKAVHVLRSMAHIIDMHQLTKDPERIHSASPPVTAGAKRPQSPAELIRYLDYCSDLLALISKIASLYVQDFDDPVTLSAVTEIENLTNGLSRKIWQKIMIFDRIFTTNPVTGESR